MKKKIFLFIFTVGLIAATYAQNNKCSYGVSVLDSSATTFDRDLIAFVEKTAASKATNAQKLLLLRDALDMAKTSAQKKAILQQIARTGTFLGLLTSGAFLEDTEAEVQQAAVQAVFTIALDHPEYFGSLVTSLLNKAIEVNKSPNADSQKSAVHKHLAALPKEGGFVSMINGKDLTGWKASLPDGRARMTPEQIADFVEKSGEMCKYVWVARDNMLVYLGGNTEAMYKNYPNLATVQEYGDFELYLDWRIERKSDSGIYLRDMPQVNLWDTSNRNASVGSGGLMNNTKPPTTPLVCADNPTEEWNSFYIKMVGDKVYVLLNGQLVVDNLPIENLWLRATSGPIPDRGPIALQAHGRRVDFRDLYIREIPRR